MSIVTVLYGPAYDGKNRYTFAKCLQRIRRHDTQTCAYLVRSEVRVRQLRDQILHELGGCFRLPIWTFPDFITALYKTIPGRSKILNSLEQTILLEHLLDERAREAGASWPFLRFREHPGLVLKIKEFLTAVRRVGIATPREFQQGVAHCPDPLSAIHEELLTLFQRYNVSLTSAHAVDETGVFLEVARRARDGQLDLQQIIPAPELLIVEGYYDFTPPEQQIFTGFSELFEQSLLTVDLPFNPYNLPEASRLPRSFHLLRRIVRFVQDSGFSVREFTLTPLSRGPHPDAVSSGNNRIDASVLAPATTPPEEHGHTAYETLPSGTFTISPCRNRKEEIIHIARQIRNVSQQGTLSRLREVGVVFPVLARYESLIREIFPRFGIPYTMFHGESLIASPVVVTIFRIFQVIVDDYSRASLSHLFSSPLVLFSGSSSNESNNAEESPPLTCETFPDLDSLARGIGIQKGRTEWIDALQASLAEFQASHPDQALPSAYGLLPTFQRFLALFSRVDSDTPRTFAEWGSLLREGIQQLHIPLRTLHTSARRLREKDVTALRTFLNILEALEQAYSSASQAFSHAPQFTFAQFVDVLRIALQSENYYPPERLDDAVFVMGRLDMRQAQFRYVFFGGLVEKDFPGQGEPHLFVSEHQAEALGLPTYRTQSEENAYLFYLHLQNPTDHLYLSYPQQEAEKDLLPSTYIDRLLRGVREEMQQDAVPVSEDGGLSLEQVHTYSELYHWIAEKSGRSAPDLVRAALRFLEQEKGDEAVKGFQLGVQAQKLRDLSALSEFDGNLTSRWAQRTLAFRYASHVYSVSEFDVYTQCPMRFFFQRLLRLEPLELALPEISAPDIGTLLHTILYRFYAGLKTPDPGLVDREFLQRRTDQERWVQEARFRMLAIAQDELKAYNFSGTFWENFLQTLLAGLGPEVSEFSRDRQGLLAHFIDYEAQNRDKAQPVYLEAHFGMEPIYKSSLHSTSEVEQSGFHLSAVPYTLHGTDSNGEPFSVYIRGKIDRIDLESVPVPSSARRKAVVYDYKSGGVPSVTKIKAGRAFQLPLYMLAAQHFLGASYEVAAGGYYQLSGAGMVGKKGILGQKDDAKQGYFPSSGRTLFDSHEEFLHLLEHYKLRVLGVAQQIRRGSFHPTLFGAQEAGCQYCSYQQICRIDHQRMSRLGKLQDVLSSGNA